MSDAAQNTGSIHPFPPLPNAHIKQEVPLQPHLPTDPPVTPPSPPLTSPPSPSPGTIDAIVAQSLMSDKPTPPAPPQMVSSPNKEAAPPLSPPETTHLVELHETEPLPEEVEGWLQKLESAGDIKLPEPITHDGDVLLADSEAQVVKEKIVLPLSQSGVQQGLTTKVTDSARWLAEWCIRLIKSMKDKVKYAPEPNLTPQDNIPKI